MGAGASSAASVDGEGHQGLGELPESCVALVLSHLDPPEICGVARLNRAFKGAASVDFVWERKLPGNFDYLVERAGWGRDDGGRKGMGKKEIYASLCRPVPFDGGAKVFWLEKIKAGFFMSISSKELSITGIDDRRYWNHIPTEETRFHTVAYVQQIWWFEVDGEIEFCFPLGTYSLFFRLHIGRASRRLGRRICSYEHVHGWDIKPVRFQVSTSCGQRSVVESYLTEPGNWVHYHVGNFIVEDSSVPIKLRFSAAQIDCTHSKGGLCVDSVLIAPSGFRPEKGVY